MKIGIIASTALLVGILAAFSTYLYVELGQRGEALTETRASLATADAVNTALLAEKAALEGSLGDANAQNVALAQDNTILEDNIAEALDDVDEWSAAYDESQDELLTSRTAYTELENQHTALEDEFGTLNTQHQSITRLYEDLDQEHETLTSEHRELTGQYDDLTREVGTLEQLSGQVTALEAEIKRLEEMRRPLILASDRNGFLCTGSMEPKLTCLDEATWVRNPRPEEITVGTTIHFTPSCWPEEDDTYSDGIAHRVMDVKIENGVYSYWPKGDANREADGCWVPFDHVQGYIVEIHKGVHPQNAALRNSVNRAARLEAEARSASEAAREEYYSIIEQYCGPSVDPGDCSLPSPQYDIAIRAHQAWVDAYEEWEQYSAYNRCWVDSASSALYWDTGEPPLYVSCILPLGLLEF